MIRMLIIVGLLLGGCAGSGSSTIRPPAPSEERLAAQLDLARGYLNQRPANLMQARPPLEKALEINPRSWEAHDLMASLLQLEGEPTLAEDSLKTALRLDRDNARVNNNYAIFLCQQGRFEESLDFFAVAARDTGYTGRAQSFENMGICARNGGRDEVARDAFGRAVALNSTLSTSLFELGRYAFTDGDLARADAYYQAFLGQSRQSPATLWFGVRLAEALGDADRVASYGLALRNLYPNSAESRRFEARPR